MAQQGRRTSRRLSKRIVTQAQAGKLAPGRYPDGNGLYLFVRAGQGGEAGSCQWLFRKTQNGKTTDKSLGSVQTMELEAARLAAADVHAALAAGATMRSLVKTKTPKIETPTFDFDLLGKTYEKLKGPFNRKKQLEVERLISALKKAAPFVQDVRELNKSHARNWRDARQADGISPASVDRENNTLRAMFTVFADEYELEMRNPFAKLAIVGKESRQSRSNKRKRNPFAITEIHKIMKQAHETSKKPELGWMWDVLTMTGARLSEIVGLRIKDVVLKNEIPHIKIQPTDDRGLKTEGSERLVPIYGHGLTAIIQAVARNTKTGFVFGDYGVRNKPGSVSAIMLQKVRAITTDETKVTHSLRHNIVDLLRENLIAENIAYPFTGHASTDVVANFYGSEEKALIATDKAVKSIFEVYSRDVVTGNERSSHGKIDTIEEWIE